MSEGVVLGLHLSSDGLPIDRLQLAILDDGKEKVLVCLVVPLGRHDGDWN